MDWIRGVMLGGKYFSDKIKIFQQLTLQAWRVSRNAVHHTTAIQCQIFFLNVFFNT